jgi:hypothetical protein
MDRVNKECKNVPSCSKEIIPFPCAGSFPFVQ